MCETKEKPERLEGAIHHNLEEDPGFDEKHGETTSFTEIRKARDEQHKGRSELYGYLQRGFESSTDEECDETTFFPGTRRKTRVEQYKDPFELSNDKYSGAYLPWPRPYLYSMESSILAEQLRDVLRRLQNRKASRRQLEKPFSPTRSESSTDEECNKTAFTGKSSTEFSDASHRQLDKPSSRTRSESSTEEESSETTFTGKRRKKIDEHRESSAKLSGLRDLEPQSTLERPGLREEHGTQVALPLPGEKEETVRKSTAEALRDIRRRIQNRNMTETKRKLKRKKSFLELEETTTAACRAKKRPKLDSSSTHKQKTQKKSPKSDTTETKRKLKRTKSIQELKETQKKSPKSDAPSEHPSCSHEGENTSLSVQQPEDEIDINKLDIRKSVKALYIEKMRQKATKSQIIAKEGGAIELLGCKLEIPPGALNEATEIEISVDNNPENYIKDFIPISPILGCKPSMAFNVPVTITMRTWCSAVDGNSLIAKVFCKKGERAWENIGINVMGILNFVSFQANHFCKYQPAKENGQSPVKYNLLNDVYMQKGTAVTVSVFSRDKKGQHDAKESLLECSFVKALALHKRLSIEKQKKIDLKLECEEPELREVKHFDSCFKVTEELFEDGYHEVYFSLKPSLGDHEGRVAMLYTITVYEENDAIKSVIERPVAVSWPIETKENTQALHKNEAPQPFKLDVHQHVHVGETKTKEVNKAPQKEEGERDDKGIRVNQNFHLRDHHQRNINANAVAMDQGNLRMDQKETMNKSTSAPTPAKASSGTSDTSTAASSEKDEEHGATSSSKNMTAKIVAMDNATAKVKETGTLSLIGTVDKPGSPAPTAAKASSEISDISAAAGGAILKQSHGGTGGSNKIFSKTAAMNSGTAKVEEKGTVTFIDCNIGLEAFDKVIELAKESASASSSDDKKKTFSSSSDSE